MPTEYTPAALAAAFFEMMTDSDIMDTRDGALRDSHWRDEVEAWPETTGWTEAMMQEFQAELHKLISK